MFEAKITISARMDHYLAARPTHGTVAPDPRHCPMRLGGRNQSVLRDYLPAIVFVILGGAVGGLFSCLNLLTGVKTRPNLNRSTPYECGLPSEIQRGFRFGISFYLIAMLFILFDIEVIFIYPIAVELRSFGGFALGETITFVMLLMIAFVYVWRRGALEWK
jgi:NADH-quinone oxidoreductase subunit A